MATRRNIALLATTTLTTATTQVEFNDLSEFQQFTVIGSVKTTATSTSRIHYRLRASTGNYATFTLNYFAGSYTEFGSAATADLTYQNFGRFTEIIHSSRPSQEFTTFILDCMNASSGSAFPYVFGKSSLGIEGANSFQYSHGQNVSITATPSSIQLFLSAGNFAIGSKFSVYGIKSS